MHVAPLGGDAIADTQAVVIWLVERDDAALGEEEIGAGPLDADLGGEVVQVVVDARDEGRAPRGGVFRGPEPN